MTVRYSRETAPALNGRAAERRQTLPEYLRQLRVSRHYRQNFVAEKLNVSRQTYSHYETGRIRPPAGALYGLAKLYGIPVEDLLSRMMFGRYGIENGREEYEGLEKESQYHKKQKHEDLEHVELKQGNAKHEGLEPPTELQYKNAVDEKPPGYDSDCEDSSRMEWQLLTCFRSLNERDKEDILSIIKIKTKNRGEKENQDAERKATV